MRMMLLLAASPLKAEPLTLFAGRLLLILGPCFLLCTGVTLINGLSLVDGSEVSRDDGINGNGDVADYEGDNVGDSEDTPHARIVPPRRNEKRVLTNTKLFYFLQSPPTSRQLSTSESQRSQVDLIADKSDYNYEYNGQSGYSHESPNSYKAIHIHSPQPVQYHGKSSKDQFWPLLLLSFLPILFGSLILLPLLISFFTQVLQLLAMMQNTINNINTTTQAPNNNGRRRRRHISKFEVDYYPNGSDEVVEQITRRLSRALLRFDALKSSSTS